jgi:hypothetical protein
MANKSCPATQFNYRNVVLEKQERNMSQQTRNKQEPEERRIPVSSTHMFDRTQDQLPQASETGTSTQGSASRDQVPWEGPGSSQDTSTTGESGETTSRWATDWASRRDGEGAGNTTGSGSGSRKASRRHQPFRQNGLVPGGSELPGLQLSLQFSIRQVHGLCLRPRIARAL